MGEIDSPIAQCILTGPDSIRGPSLAVSDIPERVAARPYTVPGTWP
jgi:hypothetical protein